MILDHVFVLPRGCPAERDRPSLVESTLEAADAFSSALAAAGFVEGSSRPHPGQGTTNRRLFLDDLMIECLLVDDETALDDPRGAPLALGERFRTATGTGGIGFGFRPDPDASEASDALPAPDFDARPYRPRYLPAHLHIDAASGLGTDAPLLFHLPFVRRGRDAAPGDSEPRAHPNGARRVGSLRLDTVDALPDGVLRVLDGAGVRCESGAAEPCPCLHARLDGAAPGTELDLRPRFPLRLHA